MSTATKENFAFCESLSTIDVDLTGLASALDGIVDAALPDIAGFEAEYTTTEIPYPDYTATIPDVPDAIDAAPSAVSYSSGNVAVPYTDAGSASQPDYETPKTPMGMPTTVIPTPNLSYPEQSPLPISRGDYDIPDAPDIEMGARPALTPITSTDFIEEVLPYDGDLGLPTFEPILDGAPAPDPELVVYNADDPLIQRMKQTMEGSDLLDRTVQNMMYLLATEKVDHKELWEVHRILAEAAAAGQSDTSGPVNKAVAEVAYEAQLQRHDAEFKIRDDVYKLAKEVLVTAISNAIKLESKHADLLIQYAKQLVESYKYNVRMHANLFNSIVEYVNAQIRMYGVVVDLYNQYVSAVNEGNETRMKKVRMEMAKVKTYQAEIMGYKAQAGTATEIAKVNADIVKAATIPLEEYDGYVNGLKANIGIVKQNVEAYRESIKAFSQYIGSEKEKLDAYSAQIQAEGSAVGVYEANVNAYADFWQIESRRAGAFASTVQEGIKALNSELKVYKDAISAQNSQIDAITAKISESAKVSRAYTDAGLSQLRYVGAYNDSVTKIADAITRQNIASTDIENKNELLRMNRDAAQKKIEMSRAAAEAAAQAAIAQSANGILNKSVSYGCNNSDTTSQSRGSNATVTTTANRQLSWNRTQSIEA